MFKMNINNEYRVNDNVTYRFGWPPYPWNDPYIVPEKEKYELKPWRWPATKSVKLGKGPHCKNCNPTDNKLKGYYELLDTSMGLTWVCFKCGDIKSRLTAQ